MELTKIIKIGGNVVDNDVALSNFLADFAQVEGRKVLVHGGGKIASSIGRSLGVEPVMVDGRRVTDAATLRVVTMVYGGLINKRIVAMLSALSCKAIGLSGVDGGLVCSTRRASFPVDYGEVGDPHSVNCDLLCLLLDGGFTPVVAPLTLSDEHTILNTNADTMAQSIATVMSTRDRVELVYTFELEGVMDKDGRVIERITPSSFDLLKADGTVSGGMLPKLENALKSISQGVTSVSIGRTIVSNF